jgi:hypothetical protein
MEILSSSKFCNFLYSADLHNKSVSCQVFAEEKQPIDVYFDRKAKPLDKLMAESQNRLLPLLLLNNEIWGTHISAVDFGQKTYQM